MKDNYYNLNRTKRNYKKRKKRKSGKRYANSHTSVKSNYRKKSAKKLNFKRVFVCIAILFIFFYFIISGISKMFSNKNNVETYVEPQKDISINMAVIGDIMCHSTNFQDAYNDDTNSYDFSYVFEDIQKYIQDADIAVGNLETTFAGKEVRIFWLSNI